MSNTRKCPDSVWELDPKICQKVNLSIKPPPTHAQIIERIANRTGTKGHLTKSQRKENNEKMKKKRAIIKGVKAKTRVVADDKGLSQDISDIISSYAVGGKKTKKRKSRKGKH